MRYFLILLLLLSIAVSATEFEPKKNPIQIVVSASTGGPADQSARMFAEYLTTNGYSAIVVNKPGANRMLGGNYMASIPDNNYTLSIGTKSDSVVNTIIKPIGIQYDEHTLTPVGLVGYDYVIFAINKTQIKSRNIQDFLTEYKTNNKKINFGVAGIVGDIATRDFIKSTNIVPTIIQYKSSPEVVAALASGVIQVGVIEVKSALPMIRGGYIGAIAVGAGPGSTRRSPDLPAVQTVQEVIKTYNRSHMFWFGVFAPHNANPEVVKFYSDMLVSWQADPDYKEKLIKILNPTPLDSQKFELFYREQIVQTKELIQSHE